MVSALCINVCFYDGRYHGEPEWPPSPARLFQALLASCGAGRDQITDGERSAFEWLELLLPPIIAAPWARKGQRVVQYVQNNDMDAVAGDPARVGEIRGAKKISRPRLFDPTVPLHYLWPLVSQDAGQAHTESICRIAAYLCQLGRGIDMAWAWGEVLDEAEAAHRLAEYPGAVYSPCAAGEGVALACPQGGLFASLVARYTAQSARFGQGSREGKVVFSRAPRVDFGQANYDSPTANLLFDIDGPPWPLIQCTALVQLARDQAAERIVKALPERKSLIERVLIGRGATEADKALRVQLMALPSIGHRHADRAIRRLVVRVPPNCPIARDDVEWAFSGLPLQVDPDSGEIVRRLIVADECGMLGHYGFADPGNSSPSRRWRTVTPLVIPWQDALRALSEKRANRDDADTDGKVNGVQRLEELGVVAHAVRQTARRAGVAARFEIGRIQREPFEANGARAEAFALDTRFEKDRLWHVEVEFTQPQAGPMVIGDGRYLGLGLMRPLTASEHESGLYCFHIEAGMPAAVPGAECVRALRRATMVRVQDTLGPRERMCTFFTGHAIDGSASRDPNHSHLAFAIDPSRARLLIIAPHRLQNRAATRDEQEALQTLDRSLRGFSSLRAGPAVRLRLAAATVGSDGDPLFRPSRIWESLTDYHPTRHAKRVSPERALIADMMVELTRYALPQPQDIEVLEITRGPRGGLAGKSRLRFATAVRGPLLIGRTRHLGGGLFAAAD